MTTAERIAAITDPGEFEILATAVLRFADLDCHGLIHAGVNDAGATIAAPLDGFSITTHTTPPKGVFVAHTTTERQKLRGKLLAADDADLKKAAGKISDCRAKIPGSAAKIVLCINEQMGREDKLYLEIAAKSAELHAELEVWDRRRLASFLDDDPNGQWLRQSHFGVSAQRPSRALLHKLGRRSIQALHDEIVRPGTIVVDRSIDRTLDAPPTPTLTWLVGPSGSGKSIAALRHAERVLDTGGFAFYLPAVVLQPGVDLAASLEHHLRELHPDLAPGVGEAALKLATELQPINLVIEDINTSVASDRLGDRLAAWATPRKGTDGAEQVAMPPVHLIVPVWPELWNTNGQAWTKERTSRVVDVGPLALDEAIAAIQKLARGRGFVISVMEAEEIAAATGNDAFLIGLLSGLASDVSCTSELLSIARVNMVDEYLRRKSSRLARTHNRPVEDYADALDVLADRMLHKRALRPTIQQVRNWLDQSQWLAISELLNDGSVCRRSAGKDGLEHLAMRHDRFQSALLARRARQLLDDVDGNAHVLRDPFYGSVVGSAIVDGAADPNDPQKIALLNPVAIFEAMRLIGEPQDDYQRSVVDICQAWAERAGQIAPDGVLWAVSHLLLATSSSAAQRVACALPQNPVLLLCRFRNGDAEAAVQYLRHPVGAYPGIRDNQFEKTLEHVKLHHSCSVSSMTLELIKHATSTDVMYGALVLAGFFPVADVASVISELMTRAGVNMRALLPALLWVGLRCAPDTLSKGPALLDRLIASPTGAPDGTGNEQWRLCQELGWAGRHGYAHESITAIIHWADAVEERRMIAVTILESVDDADAAEFLARVWSEVDGWSPLRQSPLALSTADLKHRAWSSQYMMRLQRIWSDEANTDKLRREAFKMWLEGISAQQLETVVGVQDDTVLDQQALQWRVKCGDLRATPLLIEAARAQPFWWRLAHYVWSPAVRRAVAEAIARSTDDKNALWMIADLLYEVPTVDAEEILLENESVVQDSEPLICAAAVVGTSKLQELADEALSSWTAEENPLRFAAMHLDSLRFKGGAQPARFTALERFLDKVDKDTLESFGRYAESAGAGDWAEEFVWSRTARPNGPPGDAGFVAELDSIYSDERRWPGDVRYTCDRFIRMGKPLHKTLELTFGWLQHHMDQRAIEVAGEVVAYLGGRDDLADLNTLVRAGAVSTEIGRQLDDVAFRVRRATLAATADDRERE